MRHLWLIGLLFLALLTGCESLISLSEPTQTPPDLFVQPEPFPEWAGVQPQAGATIEDQSEETVCVDVLLLPLLRPGDFWNTFENISLTMNGELVIEEPIHTSLDEATGITDDDGNTIAAAYYADMSCWSIDLKVGFHIAEALVWTSTGEEFPIRWAFQITE